MRLTRTCANGDYAQAAIDSAAAIGDAAGGGKGTVPSEGGGAGNAVLVGVGVVAAGGAGAYLYLRNRRKKAAAGRQPATARRAPSWIRWPGSPSRNCAARAAHC